MLTDAHRKIQFSCPLGPDTLLVRSLKCHEALSTPYRMDLELVSSVLSEIPTEAVLQAPVTVRLQLPGGTWRCFHGIVIRFSQGARDLDGTCVYRAEVVPWLTLLQLSADCRIFQNLSTQQIVTQIFEDFGLVEFEFRGLTRGQAPREYCVQYRESAFNFVSRLLEEEGIFYFFEHFEDRHLLVIADEALQHPAIPEGAAVTVNSADSAMLQEDVIQELIFSDELRTTKVSLADFNFTTPSYSIYGQVERGQDFEVYDHPGIFERQGEADVRARVRLEEEGSVAQCLTGRGTVRAFVVGHCFRLIQYQRAGLDPQQVLHAVTHEARQQLSMGHDGSEAFQYRNTFVSYPKRQVFRSPRRARKPFVSGTQTAIVTGKAGEEIWTDSYGRVKLHFHWDRRGNRDENSSCWVRVSHQWAGQGWGSIYLPRIGQEIIVDFLEGDPDRPIVVGRVYNASQMPPYPLPGDQTKSTIKSNSSKGGAGFNELRYEDKKGHEEIFLHAQKDLNEVILNNMTTKVSVDQSLWVGHDRSRQIDHDEQVQIGHDRQKVVGHDESFQVGHDRSRWVGNDEQVSIGSNQTLSVGANQSTQVGSAQSLTVGANQSATIGGSQSTKIRGKQSIKVSGSRSVKVSKAASELVTMAKTVTVGLALQTTVGGAMNTTVGLSNSEQTGLMKTVVAGVKIELKCGKGSITIEKDGHITIEGTKVTIIGDPIDLN